VSIRQCRHKVLSMTFWLLTIGNHHSNFIETYDPPEHFICIGCSTIIYVKQPWLYFVAGNVSAVFTYKWKGEDMARMLDDMTRRVMVKITIASHCTKPYGNINRYLYTILLSYMILYTTIPNSFDLFIVVPNF